MGKVAAPFSEWRWYCNIHGGRLMAVESLRRDGINPAFWLAPLASSIPLIPFFSLPWSPLFLGRIDIGGPFHQTTLGPWLAAAAVLFDGTILAYVMAAFLYLILFGSGLYRREFPNEQLSTVGVLTIFGVAGMAGSQFVRLVQNFRQPGLREFAVSWQSPLLGCVCGLVSGACFAFFSRRQFSPAERAFVYGLPVGVVVACGSFLVWGPGR